MTAVLVIKIQFRIFTDRLPPGRSHRRQSGMVTIGRFHIEPHNGFLIFRPFPMGPGHIKQGAGTVALNFMVKKGGISFKSGAVFQRPAASILEDDCVPGLIGDGVSGGPVVPVVFQTGAVSRTLPDGNR